MNPLTAINEFRKSLNEYSYSDRPFIYRTGAFIGRNAVSLITLISNTAAGSFFGMAGVLKICILKICQIAILKFTGHQSQFENDASWWFNKSIDSYGDLAWNLYEYVEDIGATFQNGYRALCFIDEKVDLKSRFVKLQKRCLYSLKYMESTVDSFVNLINCQHT